MNMFNMKSLDMYCHVIKLVLTHTITFLLGEIPSSFSLSLSTFQINLGELEKW
jgi:hypothetical protein